MKPQEYMETQINILKIAAIVSKLKIEDFLKDTEGAIAIMPDNQNPGVSRTKEHLQEIISLAKAMQEVKQVATNVQMVKSFLPPEAKL